MNSKFPLLSISEIKNSNKRPAVSGQKPVNELRNRTDAADQAETIRRLRIQNIKLLEQVGFLRDKISLMKSEKIQLVSKLHDERKLNKSLSKVLRS